MTRNLLLAALLTAGGVAGAEDLSPAWNANAEWFMYAPSFAFKDVAGAAKYRFRVLDDCHVTREFDAAKPSDSLEPVWERLPKGFVTVSCFALDAKGEVVGLAGERTFWKNVPFKEGACPKAKRPYAEDQFIAWETPARKDGIGFRNRPGFKARWSHGWQTKYSIWHCPAVMEQYSRCQPIDASAAKLIRTYLACYQATGDKLALAKAKALGDAAVNNQRENGLSPTGWFGNYDEYHNWINCHIATIESLQELCAAER